MDTLETQSILKDFQKIESVDKRRNPFACYGNQIPQPMDFDSKEEYQKRVDDYIQWEIKEGNMLVGTKGELEAPENFKDYIFTEREVIRNSFTIDIDIDLNFWAILPAININLHSHSFEFEWLCLGIYINKTK